MSLFARDLHFDFKDWRTCFDVLKEYRTGSAESIVLVLCTDFYASGYWIELEREALKHPDGCIFYKTDAEIESLYIRITENERLKLARKVNGGLIV